MTFEEFAEANLPGLSRFAVVLTNDRGLAEDLVQDVLLRAYGRWGRIQEVERPEAYVRRMLVNELISWRRKWGRLLPRADVADLVEARSRRDDLGTDLVERDALMADLARLPVRQRAVVVLRYLEDRPDAEIAETLGCSKSTVRVHALRALRTLRVALTEPSPVTDRSLSTEVPCAD